MAHLEGLDLVHQLPIDMDSSLSNRLRRPLQTMHSTKQRLLTLGELKQGESGRFMKEGIL